MAAEMYKKFFEGQTLRAAKLAAAGEPKFYLALEERLDMLRSNKRFINLRTVGRDTIDFSSNDALSLSSSGRLRDIFTEEMARNPEQQLGSGGSRLLDGNHPYAEELEREIAEFHGAETCLLFQSGFEANGAIFSSLPRDNDVVVYDELIHASIHQGMRASRCKTKIAFKHNDLQAYEETLNSIKASDKAFETGDRSVLISVESVYSMDGDITPLTEMVDIKKRIFPAGNAFIIVDEAHSTCVLGPQGKGLVNALGLEREIAIRLATYGKAGGTSGAVVMCNDTVKNYLMNFCRAFINTTAMTFPSLVCIKAAYIMMKNGEVTERQDRLFKLIRRFFAKMDDYHYYHKAVEMGIFRIPPMADWEDAKMLTHIVPLVTQQADSVAFNMHMQKFVAWPISFPTVPRGQDRVRLCFHADNTEAQVDALAALIGSWLKERVKAGGKPVDVEAQIQAAFAAQMKLKAGLRDVTEAAAREAPIAADLLAQRRPSLVAQQA